MEDIFYDVIVIGAGLAGIAFAKFYISVHPNCNLLILEADTCIGGSWNRRRLYQNFWTQTGLGLAEFSDMPMQSPPPEDLHNHMFDAKYLTEYLEQYTEERISTGRSIVDLVLFDFTVKNILKSGNKWEVHGSRSVHPKKFRCLLTPKLVVANGLTSVPNMPEFRNRELFEGLIAHQRDFGSSNILTLPPKRITVLGGSKSAADMVYSCAKAGKPVTWLIRESGSGPAAFVSSEGKGGYRNSAEAGATRILGTFSPSPFLVLDRWTGFLHRSAFGRKVVDAFWGLADKNARAFGDFHGRIGRRDGFEKLKPDTNIFWVNNAVGIAQHPDFWDVIAQHVQIERGDILELDVGLIRLTNGTEIPTEAILCGTGWLPHHKLFSKEDQGRLGLPHKASEHSDDVSWDELEKAADEAIMNQFPKLLSPPPYTPPQSDITPYRLYNGMVSLSDDSIIILGHMYVPNAFRSAEYQALWATAFLDKGIPNLPSQSEMKAQIALQTAWCRRRYLNNGRLGNFIYHDLIGYTDKLLTELGLEEKKKGWWNYWFAPCMAVDLREAREVLRKRLMDKTEYPN